MFTGLILGVAHITTIQKQGVDTRFTLQPRKLRSDMADMADMKRGESIAINGVCLTVETFTPSSFSVYASAETLRCTTLKSVSAGHLVNIERALRLMDRLGGHMVTGHVDTLGTISHISHEGQSLSIGVSIPEPFMPQILPKGSIALDGISLTINKIEGNIVFVNCIPETAKITNIDTWRVGTCINIETDIVGKYVLRHLSGMGFKHTIETVQNEDRISVKFLQEHGFLP